MMVRKLGKLVLILAPAALLALAGCGVSTNAAGEATPSPSLTATPTPSATPTATPSPTPTPAPKTGTCSFVWLTDYSAVDGTVDFYEVDVLASAFANSTVAFDGTNAVGYYVSGYDPNDGSISIGAGMSTSGAIALNVSDTTMGTAASFTDTADHNFFDAKALFTGASNSLGAQVTTGGKGSFTGNISNPDPTTAVDPGTGVITVSDGGGSEIFGDPTGTSTVYIACSP